MIIAVVENNHITEIGKGNNVPPECTAYRHPPFHPVGVDGFNQGTQPADPSTPIQVGVSFLLDLSFRNQMLETRFFSFFERESLYP